MLAHFPPQVALAMLAHLGLLRGHLFEVLTGQCEFSPFTFHLSPFTLPTSARASAAEASASKTAEASTASAETTSTSKAASTEASHGDPYGSAASAGVVLVVAFGEDED